MTAYYAFHTPYPDAFLPEASLRYARHTQGAQDAGAPPRRSLVLPRHHDHLLLPHGRALHYCRAYQSVVGTRLLPAIPIIHCRCQHTLFRRTLRRPYRCALSL